MRSDASPNPLQVAWSVRRAGRTARPNPVGSDRVDHSSLRPILELLRSDGVPALDNARGEIESYRKSLESVDPDLLTRDESLAYWINLYNAGALDLAARTSASQTNTVLGVRGAFSGVWANVSGEALSLTEIEHGKIRRFGDPRFHGSLVCGSASCPTLRHEPFRGDHLSSQLDHQMSAFLAGGGADANRSSATLRLSRIFLWYGADFVRPHRMPTWIPARKRRVAAAIRPWLQPDVAAWLDSARPSIVYQDYSWDLACSIG